jgi:glycosyltransferase involved in cell wall biosynthesis
VDGIKVHRFIYFWPSKYESLCYEGTMAGNLDTSLLAKIQLPFFILFQAVHLAVIIVRDKVDVIHSHWMLPSGLAASVVGSVFGVRHVLTIHAADIFHIRHLPFSGLLARFILGGCDSVVAVSSYVSEVTRSVAGNRTDIKILPMGVDTSVFNDRLDKEEARKKLEIPSGKILLFVGAIREKKGLEYLIKAMPEMLEAENSITLVVAGSGPLLKSCRTQANNLGLADRVIFKGRVPHELLPTYYAASDLVVVPSIIDNRGETEGMPVVVLEAMASGKPVVGTSVSGIIDVIKDGVNGFIVNEKDSTGLAEKIIDVFSSKDLETLREKALDTGEANSIEKISREYINLYTNQQSRGKRL